MILEVVTTLKMRGLGIIAAGTRFGDGDIPKPILKEFKSGSGLVRRVDLATDIPPELEEMASVEAEEPEEAPDEAETETEQEEDSEESEEKPKKKAKPKRKVKRSPKKEE